MKQGFALILLLTLAACTTYNADLDPELHGQELPEQTNLPRTNGELTVTGTNVNYYEEYTGYYAEPTTPGTYPGIIMIHEWWGLNEHIKETADTLSSHGYRVLAVDLFGTVAKTSEEARAQVSSFDQEQGISNLKAAVTHLEKQETSSIASLGWCFGGAQSLQLGIAEDLDATIIYYGRVITEKETLSNIEQPVLGIFAELDGGIPVSDVEAFDTTLDEIGIENDINIYPGVNHAFANPSGDRYNEAAAEDAWNKTLTFLEEHLQ